MASNPLKASDTVGFGGNIELDLRRRELRRAGAILKLERIPTELLCLLVEQRGEIVTRNQIVDRIWGPGVFLDTDNSINGAIRKIRQVLQDDSDQPRFVQTIMGRGYRFIAPVAEAPVEFPNRPASHDTHKRPQLVVERPPGVWQRTWIWALICAAILVAGIAISTVGRWRRPETARLTEKDTIVLSDFTNTTGDPVFDEALKQALSVVLIQSPFLNIASDLQVNETLSRMGRAEKGPLSSDIAREVCLRMGGKAVFAGSISSLGSHYVVGLRALGCVGGELLGTGQAEAADKEGVLKALGGVALQVRRQVGESLSSLQKYDFPVDTTTKSLEALAEFSLGQKALRESGETEAIPFFRQAVQHDPEFALAYASLGRAYEDVGEDREAVDDFARAYNLRDRLSEREKYYITTLYCETVTGDMEKAKEVGELWTQVYPRDEVAHERLGTIYGELGDHEKASMESLEAMRIDSKSTINVSNAITSFAYLNRIDKAQELLDAGQARETSSPLLHENTYALAFLRGDQAEMERQMAWAATQGDEEFQLFSDHAATAAYSGQLRKARELSRRAVESAIRSTEKEVAAVCQIDVALREAETGNLPLVKQSVQTALAISSNRDVRILAALALARSGNTAPAEAIARALEQQNPSNTLIRRYWLPAVRASLALRAGNPRAALADLQVAGPYELSQTVSASNESGMYPTYIRGEVQLSAHNGQAAAAEFKKLLSHPGLLQNSILSALSRLQLARAEVMTGDFDSARRQYDDFFLLWKDADAGIPILQQAKAEYAKL